MSVLINRRSEYGRGGAGTPSRYTYDAEMAPSMSVFGRGKHFFGCHGPRCQRRQNKNEFQVPSLTRFRSPVWLVFCPNGRHTCRTHSEALTVRRNANGQQNGPVQIRSMGAAPFLC